MGLMGLRGTYISGNSVVFKIQNLIADIYNVIMGSNEKAEKETNQ